MSNGQPSPKGVKLEYENVKVGITDDVITINVHTHDGDVATIINQKTGQVVGGSGTNAPK